MIIDMPSTTTSAIAKELVSIREEGGAVALGRVLTLLIVTGRDTDEQAILAANEASAEHPMRVIVLELEHDSSEPRLDAQIRVGGDAGASEVVRLRAHGEAAHDPETLVQGLLLPDAPVVTWWTERPSTPPSFEPLGRLAQLRITDAAPRYGEPDVDSRHAIKQLAEGFIAGDSDLAWTRLTAWRALLASVLDQPPYEDITRVHVTGAPGSATARLMAAWLGLALRIRVKLIEHEDRVTDRGAGLSSVELTRASGTVRLERVSEDTIELDQTGAPIQHVALPLSTLTQLLAEEVRSLAPDTFLGRVLREGLPLVDCASDARARGANAE